MIEKVSVTDPSSAKTDFTKGLEGVVAAQSAVTYLDGLEGRMLYKGYNILDLAGHVIFEEVLYLLWEGDLPSRKPLEAFSKTFIQNRALPPAAIELMGRIPKTAHPMDVLRTIVSFLGACDSESSVNKPEVTRRKSAALVAQMATITAAWDRIRKGHKPISPDASLPHSANFLYMLTGRKPSLLEVEGLDLYLTLLADHDLNASTFTGRVVVSTLSDIHSAITAALGCLKGPLHGGANQKAMEMFLEIGDVSRAESYIEKAIAEKRKIMGFGHRVYKVEDPRSGPLKTMSRRLSEEKKEMKWYDISVKVAEVVHERKNINTNVDFYSASVLYLLGIHPDLFTPLFAVSRVAGWTAHIMEQMKDNRLIRPNSEYIGPAQRNFNSIDKRS